MKKSEATIQWVIDVYNNDIRDTRKTFSGKRNHYYKESKRLKVCTRCSFVWELKRTGACVRYDHLPTYGLKRAVCTLCKGYKRGG